MSKEEEEDFLYRGRIIRLATRGKSRLHIHPMWYLYEDAKFYIYTEADSVKVKNIKRNGQVSMCVDSGEHYYDLKNVKLHGKATILRDEDRGTSIMEKMLVKYLGSCSHPKAKETLSHRSKFVVIEIKPSERRHSENFSRILLKAS